MDSKCPICSYEELNWWGRIKARRRYYFPTRQERFQAVMEAQKRVFECTFGKGPKSWYAVHRERYIKLGDAKELERMTRHVMSPLR